MTTDKLNFINAEIHDQWRADDNARPWLLMCSGGKDSTMLAQMVWYMLRELSPEERQRREVHLVLNNTMVENPTIVRHTNKLLKLMETAANAQGLPIQFHRTKPKLEDSFWVKLIGKGYPAPNRKFRWCTKRLKIDPTTRLIKEMVSKRGEVILLLGTRETESTNRAKSMKNHEFGNYRLRRHTLPGSYAYPAIRHVHTDEVWQYLLAVPSPWGASNRDLVTMYRNASGGDCPLVMDVNTPSCGNSRFGCWTCTVVRRDKSMEALIENGEEWMQPMLDFRDLLAESKDRMDWRFTQSRSNPDQPGPYLHSTRVMLLRKLLEAQAHVQEHDPTMELITTNELIAIGLTWMREGLFKPTVGEVMKGVRDGKIVMV